MPTATDSALVATERQLPAIQKIKEALELRIEDLETVLPPGMDAQRFARVALLAVSKNSDLLECTPSSIIRAIVEAAEIGLEPTGSLNRAWLVPFRENAGSPKQAQLMIGYQGYADLIRDSGKITRLTAEVVFEGDTFRVVKGSETPRIIHTPRYKTEDPTKITYVYAVAWFADGGVQFEVMTRDQVEVIRSKSRQKNGSTWTQNWPQMARKTVVRRIANYLPLGERILRGGTSIAEVFSRDDEREFGEGPVVVASSGTARVRDRLKARRTKDVTGDAVPAESAAQQPDAATQQPEEAESGTDEQKEPAEPVAVVCGVGSDPALGDVDVCELAPGHDGPHKAANGTVFPNKP